MPERSSPGVLAAVRTRIVFAWFWLRCTYAFNWAHRPLCARFRDGVLRVGRAYVCRSCTLVYASAAATALLIWAAPSSVPSPFVFYALFVFVMTLSCPALYERFPRPAKDVVRVATGALLALMVQFFVAGWWGLGLLNAAVFAACYRLYLAQYKQWKLRACDGCPERGGGICSGFRMQADGVRAYEAAAEDYLGRYGRL
jgi:hypothetical protein